MNTLIDKLPIELHIPGYNYCGPGTKLEKRLKRGDRGINPLDDACKDHDIAYSKGADLAHRHEADKILAGKAWARVSSRDASLLERTAALTVANIMNGKVKLGAGMNKTKKSLCKLRAAMKKAMKKKTSVRRRKPSQRKGKKKIVIPVPRKRGGILPLLPIFAGLSALGALGGGAAQIVKAVKGSGLYVRPYKSGKGIRLKKKP